MAQSSLRARGAVAIGEAGLFLGCTGVGLFCPMTADRVGPPRHLVLTNWRL